MISNKTQTRYEKRLPPQNHPLSWIVDNKTATTKRGMKSRCVSRAGRPASARVVTQVPGFTRPLEQGFELAQDTE